MKVTKHAEKRLRERAGIKKGSSEKMARRALEEGIHHYQTNGALKKYLSMVFLSERKANNMRIYGEHIYLFNNRTLLTVLILPKKHRNVVTKLKKKLEESKKESLERMGNDDLSDM